MRNIFTAALVSRLLAGLVSVTCFAGWFWFFGLHREIGFVRWQLLDYIGNFFSPARRLVVGGALDQPSLHKILFLFCFSAVITVPAIVVIRLVNARNAQPVRIIFSVLSLGMLLHPFLVLTFFTGELLRYIGTMGITGNRLLGLAIAAAGYAILVFVGTWIFRTKK